MSSLHFKRTLNNKYDIGKQIGSGSHSVVWHATNKASNNEEVAIKEVLNLRDTHMAKRCYREIKLLKHFDNHPNIVSMKDLFLDSDSVYIVMDRMNLDLHQLISLDIDITSDHIILFTYQILCGLKALHSAGVIHRDLKPQNILINSTTAELKLCDFGTARSVTNNNKAEEKEEQVDGMSLRMTCLKEVATPYYRAPEGILFSKYSKSVDIWATGCILGEMIIREPLFPAKNNKELIKMIIHTIGLPPPQVTEKSPNKYKELFLSFASQTPSKEAGIQTTLSPLAPSPLSPLSPTSHQTPHQSSQQQHLSSATPLRAAGIPAIIVNTPQITKTSLKDILRTISAQNKENASSRQQIQQQQRQEEQAIKVSSLMIDLMSLLLKFDPDERITVEQALEHSLLEELHHPPEEVTFSLFEDPWDKLETTGSAITLEKWKEILRGEIKVFNPVTVTSTRRRSPNSQGAAYSQ